MDHVAIDLGARKSQICVRSADGEIVEEKRLETWDIKGYLASRPKSRVIVETCAEAFGVAAPRRNWVTTHGSCRRLWCGRSAWERDARKRISEMPGR
jgi:hypothetical protein